MNYLLYILLAGLTAVFVFEMIHSLRRSEAAAALVRKYFDDKENPALIDEIFVYCNGDFKLRRVMTKHNAQKEDIARIYNKLRVWGDIKKGRRYVPITSFFYVYALEWLLTHREVDEKETAMKMMNFLHI